MKWRRIIVVSFRLFVCLLSAMLIPHRGGEEGREEKIPDKVAEIILLELLQ